MIKANFKIDPIMEKISRMTNLMTDMRPVLLKIQGTEFDQNQNTIIGGINAQFITQGSFFGEDWKSLSTDYAQWKRKKYGLKSMLRATDKLFQAVTKPGALGNVQNLSWTRLVWGVDKSIITYAGYIMTGTSKMVARKYLGITKQQKDTWKMLIKLYLMEVRK